MRVLCPDCGVPDAVIRAILEVFKQYPAVEQVILYGSRATGAYHKGSDIDLCLIAPALTRSEQGFIENQLEDLLLPWKIDLAVKHTITSPELVTQIEKTGLPLWKLG